MLVPSTQCWAHSPAHYKRFCTLILAAALLSVAVRHDGRAEKRYLDLLTATGEQSRCRRPASDVVDPTRRRVMNKQEPPSTRSHLRSPLFFIGKNSRGNWVAQDQQHLSGGLFVDRAAAVRYALFENGNQPQSVIMVPGVLELDLNSAPRIGQQPQAAANSR
jgi:hypothetical protein